MLTASAIMAPMLDQLDCHRLYAFLAIGWGAMACSWMNDSGFWVITRMSGMTEGEGLKYVTPMSALMGFVGLGVVMLGVTFLPYPFG